MTIDLTPKTNLLKIYQSRRAQPHRLAAEAIDNAFDAGASVIHITMNNNEIIFTDDGHGIDLDTIPALGTLGDHVPSDTTALGRYGIGITTQALIHARCLGVNTVSARHGRLILNIDWEHIDRTKTWSTASPLRAPMGLHHPTGTKIILTRLNHKLTSKMLEKTVDDARSFFYPALRQGRRIIFNDTEIIAPGDPELTDIIMDRIVLAPNKEAIIYAGLKTIPAIGMRGVDVVYKHRVIMPAGVFGCNGYSIGRMFARVTLSDGWTLGEYKDDLTDLQADELEDRVHDLLRPLLEKCRSEGMTAELEQTKAFVDALIPAELRPMRPKKQNILDRQGPKRRQQGTAIETPDPTGPARPPRARRNQLDIKFEHLGGVYGLGHYVRSGNTARVELDEDNPLIFRLLADRDKLPAAQQIVNYALSLFILARPDLFSREDYGLHWWNLIKAQPAMVDIEAAE